MSNLDTIDPTFAEDLANSDAAVLKVALWLRRQGFSVLMPPVLLRPSADQHADYSDGGDLAILSGVEVKHRLEIDFTQASEFPFSTIIVDQKRDFDRKNPKPERYFICNKSLSHAAIIGVRSTQPHWKVVHRANGRTNRASEYYEVDLKHVAFRNLDE